MPTIITAKNISMSYEGKRVLESVSFEISAGDYLCVIGENGSGKTTLMKALIGLKKINSGELIFSKDIKKSDIGYLPQQTEFQRDFPASVSEVVLSGCINNMGLKPFYTKKEKLKAKSALEMLEISDLAAKCYHELSGGQQQRVLLARAICASEKILILDEPTTGLDTSSSEEFYSIISRLNSAGMTIIMISHDIKNSLKYANKVLHLGEGAHHCFGTTNHYLQHHDNVTGTQNL